MQKEKKPQNGGTPFIGEKTPARFSGLAYSASALAFFGVAFLFLLIPAGDGKADWYLYLGFLAAPVAFSVSAYWYFSYTDESVKGFFKEQKCHPKYYWIALFMQIGLLSLGELNGLFLKFLERFGYQSTELLLPSLDGFGFVGVLFVVAVLPAVMEEFFFRGIFLRGMKNFSLLAQVLVGGALFSLYHQNPAQTAYQFVCGMAFTLVGIKAGSFLPTVLSHFINNAVILVLYKLGISSYPLPTYVIILVISGICLVGTVGYLLVFDGKKEEKKKTEKGELKSFFGGASAGLFVFALSWLATLFAGF